MRKNMHKPPKRSNFAIRKLTIGAAAVLLVGPLIGARTQNVQASETVTAKGEQVATDQHAEIIKAATVVGIIPTAASVSSNRPQGSTVTWVREPDVSKKGTSRGRVRITGQSVLGIPFAYEQWVDVTVYAQNEWYDPKMTDLTTEAGSPLKAAQAVTNLANLPQGTNISWAIEPNWAKAGNYSAQIQVTYPDQTLDIATVQVNVKEQLLSEKYQLQVTDLVTSVGKKVSATAAVTNAAYLPAGTKITWQKEPDTTKAGSTTGTVLVTYPDNSTDQAVVNVQVKEEAQKPTDADRFTPDFQDLETTVGNKLSAEEAVKNKAQDWQVVWHEAPNFEKAGVYQVTVKVFYPDGSHDEGRVKVTVKEPAAELEEITDHTQHADLVKKVTRTIHVHHPAGDKVAAKVIDPTKKMKWSTFTTRPCRCCQ